MIVLSFLIPLVTLVAIVAGVAAVVRRSGTAGGDGGGARRIVVLFLAFGLLILAAVGLSQLVALLIPAGATVVARTSGDVAAAVSLTVVAVPSFLGLWRYLWRRMQADPAESESAAWAAFAVLSSITFLIGALVGLGNGLEWLLGLDERGPTALAFGLVWSAVWVAIWRVTSGPHRPRQLSSAPAVLGSIVGLWVGSVALGGMVAILLSAAYDRLTGAALAAAGLGEGLGRAGLWLVLGGVVWWWHWLRHGQVMATGALRTTYLLVFGVLSGALVALGAAGSILYTALEWFLGTSSASSAVGHFAPLPSLITAASVGLLVWAYHRSLVLRSPGVFDTDVGRTYRYLLAGTGLVAAASGLGVVINALLGALVPPLTDRGDVVNLLLGGITALVVGLPVWWRTWAQVQGRRSPEELGATPRRIYLTLLAGLGGVVVVVTAIVFLFRLLEGLLEGDRLAALVDQVRAPLGLLAATGVVAGYHLAVWRRDREVLPSAPPPPTLREVVLAAPEGTDLAGLLRRDGTRVIVWRLAGPPVEVDEELVSRMVAEAGAPRLLVVVEEGTVRAYPLLD